MYDNVITGKENASKEYNYIMSMFLTSFNVYFVFGYTCLCVDALKLLSGFFCFFGTRSGIFGEKQVSNPGLL